MFQTPVTKSLYLTLLVLALSWLPGGLIAHTALVSSSPADGDTLQQSPDSVELVFQAPVRLMKFELATAAGQPVTLQVPRGNEGQERFSIPLTPLQAGQYRASWTVMGSDTHRMTGTFAFAIGEESNSAPNAGGNQDDHHNSH